MQDPYESTGFWDQISEFPLFFRIFGGALILLVVGVFLYAIIRGLSSWLSNNAAEVLQRPCKVADKRTVVRGGSGDSSTSTDYYITFEFEDFTRKEFEIRSSMYGLISVGDKGELVYQGTRFKNFTRTLGDRHE